MCGSLCSKIDHTHRPRASKSPPSSGRIFLLPLPPKLALSPYRTWTPGKSRSTFSLSPDSVAAFGLFCQSLPLFRKEVKEFKQYERVEGG